jgi:hypothetical protein
MRSVSQSSGGNCSLGRDRGRKEKEAEERPADANACPSGNSHRMSTQKKATDFINARTNDDAASATASAARRVIRGPVNIRSTFWFVTTTTG